MVSAVKTAHGRVANALKRGHGVSTPFGRVFSRPSSCQMCGESPKPHTCGVGTFQSQSAIQAHHYKGYGTLELDLRVVFVCRICHAIFHRTERKSS